MSEAARRAAAKRETDDGSPDRIEATPAFEFAGLLLVGLGGAVATLSKQTIQQNVIPCGLYRLPPPIPAFWCSLYEPKMAMHGCKFNARRTF